MEVIASLCAITFLIDSQRTVLETFQSTLPSSSTTRNYALDTAGIFSFLLLYIALYGTLCNAYKSWKIRGWKTTWEELPFPSISWIVTISPRIVTISPRIVVMIDGECRILLDSCLLRAFSFWSASMNDVIDSPLKTHFPRDNGIFSGSGIRTCPPRFLILLKRQLPFYYLTIDGKRLIVLKIKRIASILPLVTDIVRYS